MKYKNIDINWLGHDSFLIKTEDKVIYIDPYKIDKKDLPEPDIIITTHEHFDHANPEMLNTLSTDKTILIGPKSTKLILKAVENKKEIVELNVGDNINVLNFNIKAIPAYNTHRFREPGKPFHPKENGHIGPILDINGITIYHAGDTDKIPEMKGLKPNIALIPVSGTYVMDVNEAVEAAKLIDAEITIPMHVGRGIGKLEYRDEFKNKSEMNVIVLDIEK